MLMIWNGKNGALNIALPWGFPRMWLDQEVIFKFQTLLSENWDTTRGRPNVL